jgi:hypothetical protein
MLGGWCRCRRDSGGSLSGCGPRSDGLVADASRLATGSIYRMAQAMRATRDMSVRPMVSAALLPSRGRSEERPSPA